MTMGISSVTFAYGKDVKIEKITTASNGKVGAVSAEGKTIIPASYDMIRVLDIDETKYYLVMNNKQSNKKGGIGIFDMYGNVVFKYMKTDDSFVSYVEGEAVNLGNYAKGTSRAYDLNGKSLLPKGYVNVKAYAGNVLYVVKKSDVFEKQLIFSNGKIVTLDYKDQVQSFIGSKNFIVAKSNSRENALKIYSRKGEHLGNFFEYDYEEHPEDPAKGFLFTRYTSEQAVTDKPSYLGDKFVKVFDETGKLISGNHLFERGELAYKGIIMSYTESIPTKNDDIRPTVSRYFDYDFNQLKDLHISGGNFDDRLRPEYLRLTNQYPFNQELLVYRELTEDPYVTGNYRYKEGLCTLAGEIVLPASLNITNVLYNFGVMSEEKMNKDGSWDRKKGVYDVVKNEVVLELGHYDSVKIFEKEIRAYPPYGSNRKDVVIEHQYGPEYVQEAVITVKSDDVYYPTMQKDQIKFQNDEKLRWLLVGYETLRRGFVQNNSYWMGESATIETSDAVVTFEGNNVATITLRGYNHSIKNWLRTSLSEVFTEEVIYPVLDVINNEIMQTADKRLSWYETSKIDDLVVQAGLIKVQFDDQDSALKIKLDYDSDVLAKGQQSYNDALFVHTYDDIQMPSDSITEAMQLVVNNRSTLNKNTNPSLKNELMNKLSAFADTLNKRYKGKKYEVSIVDSLGYMEFMEVDGASKNTRVTYRYDNDQSTFEMKKYNEDIQLFIDDMLKSRYGAYGQSVADRIKIDFDQTETSTGYSPEYALDKLMYQMDGKCYTIGPLELEYESSIGGRRINIYHRYPIYDAVKVEPSNSDVFSFDRSVLNTGRVDLKPLEYYYNYFKKYGTVSTDYDSGDIRIYDVYFEYWTNKHNNYPYLTIFHIPGTKKISANFKAGYIFQDKPYVLDILEDYFTVTLGSDYAAEIRKHTEGIYVERTMKHGNYDIEDIRFEPDIGYSTTETFFIKY